MKQHGEIIYFCGPKLFGFIKPDDATTGVLFTVNDVLDGCPTREGTRVHFCIGEDEAGRPVAKFVKAI